MNKNGFFLRTLVRVLSSYFGTQNLISKSISEISIPCYNYSCWIVNMALMIRLVSQGLLIANLTDPCILLHTVNMKQIKMFQETEYYMKSMFNDKLSDGNN